MRQSILVAVLLACSALTNPLAAAPPTDALQLLPPDPLIYMTAPSPSALIDHLANHPVRKKLEAIAGYQKALDSDEYRKFLGGVALVQSQLGKTWQDALASLIGEGVHVSFDAKQQGACMIAKAKDPEFTERAKTQLLAWAKYADKNAVKTVVHRGVEMHTTKDGGAIAVWDSWIAASNQRKLLEGIIDRSKDGGVSLADQKRMTELRPKPQPARRLWAFVDLEQLRGSGEAQELFRDQAENPAAEILFGGVLANLKHTDALTAELLVQGENIRLAFQTPHKPAWGEGPREHFFGPKGKGVAKEYVALKGELMSVAAYRDIARMWLQADDLFAPEMVDSLTEADSNLTTLFGGRDFGEDILGSLEPEVQLVIAQQAFPNPPQPAIKLPGFALIAQMKDPVKMQPDLRRTYQSLIGFLNVVGAMEGNPQLDLGQQNAGKGVMHTAVYVPEPEEKTSKTARIFFNFSPTIAFQDELVVFSSSIDLAKTVLSQIGKNAPAQAAATRLGGPDNTVIKANAESINEALAANRSQLIAQNMLEEGTTRAEAEVAIDTLLQVVEIFDSASVRLRANEKLQLQIDAKLAP